MRQDESRYAVAVSLMNLPAKRSRLYIVFLIDLSPVDVVQDGSIHAFHALGCEFEPRSPHQSFLLICLLELGLFSSSHLLVLPTYSGPDHLRKTNEEDMYLIFRNRCQ